jgi:hypothetical protein
MSLAELKENEVKVYSDIPRWKHGAAEVGQRFVLEKCFPGSRIGRMRSLVRWFAGEPTSKMRGCTHPADDDVIWISAELKSWEEIIEISAHEEVHNLGYHDEPVPTLVGQMAAAHYTGRRSVYVKRGDWKSDWMPEGVEALPHNAVLLVFDGNGDASTAVNHGSPTRPAWRLAVIP